MESSANLNQRNRDLTTGGETLKTVSGFLQGVVSDQYEIKLIRRYTLPDGSPRAYVMTRSWNDRKILKSIERIKRRNNEGFNVYIRPLDNKFILLDDLQRNILESLAKIKPCLLMETSLGNFQAWVKLDQVPSDRIELTNLWRSLAIQFNADLGSAKPDQIGRLPGFFNMKSKYGPNFPMVKLHKYENRLSTWQYDNAFPPPVVKISKPITRNPGRDRSGFDFALACLLIEKNWTDQQIINYLIIYSQKGKERGIKYLKLTVSKARKKLSITV